MENQKSNEKGNWLSINKSLEKIKYQCKFTGLNVETRKRTFIENLIYGISFITLNIDIIGGFVWFYVGAKSGKSFTELTFVAPCVTLSTLADFKSGYLIANEAEMHKLLDNIRRFERTASKMSKQEEDLTKPDMMFLNKIIKVLNVLNVLMIVVFDFTPLILIAVTYFRTNELKLMLPYLDIYPFGSYDLRYWPYSYIHQIWNECIVLLQVCATDYLFFICCTHIMIQFKLLQCELEKMIPNETSDVQGTNNIEIRNKFIELIKWHQDLISTAQLLEVVYTKSTMFNFIVSSFVICLTGFNVTIVDDIMVVMTFMTFLFMSLLQIFFLCLFGDMLMRSSIQVSEAVYNSRWYMTPTLGKNVLLVLTRSQKPCKVTAAGFADVNLNAFMRTLSTSWSYFALLQTVYSSK